LAFDVTSNSTFQRLAFYKNEFSVALGSSSSPAINLNSFPFVVIGNKSDLVTQKEVDKKSALDWCEKNNCIYFETSAKEGENVVQAFTTSITAAANRKFARFSQLSQVSQFKFAPFIYKNESKITVVFPKINCAKYDFQLLDVKTLQTTITIGAPSLNEINLILPDSKCINAEPIVFDIKSPLGCEVLDGLGEYERKETANYVLVIFKIIDF